MGIEVTVSSDAAVISQSSCVILPGVGNFGSGMRNLRARGLVEALNEVVLNKGVPLLGICLGMQLLADESEEAPGVKGFGWIPGKVQRFRDKSLRLPHMGFNAVAAKKERNRFFPQTGRETRDYYFVHSYFFSPDDDRDALAITTYGSEFVSAVAKNRIVGVQFHPEKSQSNGLAFIADFLKFSAVGSHG
jgi:glutamine amidotransferase